MATEILEPPGFREILTDVIRYWEPRRLIYNAALVGVVVLSTWRTGSLPTLSYPFETYLTLFILAVLANVCYCAAHVVDFVLQMSSFRQSWRRRRVYLLILGMLFAGALTYFFASSLVTVHSSAVLDYAVLLSHSLA